MTQGEKWPFGIPGTLKAWYKRNFTWRGVAGLFFLLAKVIPDYFWRKDFWSSNLPMIWKVVSKNSTLFTVLVVGLVIWVDHRSLLKKRTETYDPTTLRGRTLQFCETLRQFQKEVGPEPKILFQSGMNQTQFNEANIEAARREQKMHHGFQLRFSEQAAQLWHEHAEEMREDIVLGNALAGRIDNNERLNEIIKRFAELAEGSD